jgi:hypothetical protein
MTKPSGSITPKVSQRVNLDISLEEAEALHIVLGSAIKGSNPLTALYQLLSSMDVRGHRTYSLSPTGPDNILTLLTAKGESIDV